ncbi:MAG: FtsX-like permease family protein [Deltaproteobacteria bacterium]|nr:FtsX-like permease family protein [Deltaproteobacteria bacterium]
MASLRTAPIFSLRLLIHEPARLWASIGGVTFALLLMLLQVGFRNALLDSALQLLRSLDADIIVMDKEKKPFLARVGMAKERLYQAQSIVGVESAAPLWLSMLQWKNMEDGTVHPIRVVGLDPDSPTFLQSEVNALIGLLRQPGTALIDSRSRSSYGYVGRGMAQVGRTEIEIVGTFPLGTDFEVDGTILVSEETYFKLTKYQRFQTHKLIEVALLKLGPDADEEAVLASLAHHLPTDAVALSKQQLIERDLEHWKSGTPISVILMVGVALGFAVGVVICYQILYTEVLDHLTEFATLKAIGYSDRYIQIAVVVEAWVLSIFGFLPAMAIGWTMLETLRQLSGLPAGLGVDDAVTILILSITMCTLAGILALRKVRVLDPAELF